MAETTITVDQLRTKCGVREGWDIDVNAGVDINGETTVHVWITPPGGQRIVLRHEPVQPSDAVDAVRRGWTLAISEIDRRIGEGRTQ